jgi:hypothetical protein
VAKVKLVNSIALTVVFAGWGCAQDNTYHGQTWVGLLVADSCKMEGPNAATRESDLTTSGRTTTPVDQSGTRGSSSALDPTAAPPAGSSRDVPHTGDIQKPLPKGLKDPGWAKAVKQAKALGAPCRVTVNTQRFLLLTPSGDTIPFDDLANAAVRKQLPALDSAGKIFRVHVTGKLQNDKIALNSVRF